MTERATTMSAPKSRAMVIPRTGWAGLLCRCCRTEPFVHSRGSYDICEQVDTISVKGAGQPGREILVLNGCTRRRSKRNKDTSL